MANKQLNARFQQKHDTEANWNRVGTTFTPLKGEVIVYDVDSAHSVPRFKIGDGTTKLSSLPFYQSGVQKVTSGIMHQVSPTSQREQRTVQLKRQLFLLLELVRQVMLKLAVGIVFLPQQLAQMKRPRKL